MAGRSIRGEGPGTTKRKCANRGDRNKGDPKSCPTQGGEKKKNRGQREEKWGDNRKNWVPKGNTVHDSP